MSRVTSDNRNAEQSSVIPAVQLSIVSTVGTFIFVMSEDWPGLGNRDGRSIRRFAITKKAPYYGLLLVESG